MFAIVVNEKGGEQKRLEFDKPEVTIGRVQGNDIILPKGNVSKYHSRIVLKDGKFIIVDMKSTNGTYVNGKKIAAPQVVRPSDKIYIGDYIINVEAPADGDEEAEEDDAEAQGDEGDGGGDEEAQGDGEEQGDEEQEEEPAEQQDEQAEDEEEPAAEDEEPEEEEPPPRPKDKGRMPASMAAALAR